MDALRLELLIEMENRMQEGYALHIDEAFEQSFRTCLGPRPWNCRLFSILPEFRKYESKSFYLWPLQDWKAVITTIQTHIKQAGG